MEHPIESTPVSLRGLVREAEFLCQQLPRSADRRGSTIRQQLRLAKMKLETKSLRLMRAGTGQASGRREVSKALEELHVAIARARRFLATGVRGIPHPRGDSA